MFNTLDHLMKKGTVGSQKRDVIEANAYILFSLLIGTQMTLVSDGQWRRFVLWRRI